MNEHWMRAGRALAVAILATAWLPARGQETAPPAGQATGPAGLTPRDVLRKAMETYAGATSYEGDWTYTLQRGAVEQRMKVQIRSKTPARLVFRVLRVASGTAAPPADAIPEMAIVLDGKTAWFFNGQDRAFFRADLPRGARATPLMFFPQMVTKGEVRDATPAGEAGRGLHVIEAQLGDGGKTRMEVDAATFRIRRIVEESAVGTTRVVSTIAMTREVFGGEIPDKTFAYRPPKDAREIPSPPGTAALFAAEPG